MMFYVVISLDLPFRRYFLKKSLFAFFAFNNPLGKETYCRGKKSPFRTTECTFASLERRFLCGIKSFTYSTEKQQKAL